MPLPARVAKLARAVPPEVEAQPVVVDVPAVRAAAAPHHEIAAHALHFGLFFFKVSERRACLPQRSA
jgi:hypothetical protein